MLLNLPSNMLFAPKGVMSTLKSPVKASVQLLSYLRFQCCCNYCIHSCIFTKSSRDRAVDFGTAGHIEDAVSVQLCEKAGAAISVSDINNVKNFIFFMI